jgi:hypothetical protein
LTVSQLLKERERFLGRRVTVRGDVGLVLLHRKSFYLKAPEGMVEVVFADLRDKMGIDRLTSQDIRQPVTVTGQFLPVPGPDPNRLQIMAETVDF